MSDISFPSNNHIYTLYITAYEDLQTRKETREAAWQRPGWDECVAYTGKVLYIFKDVNLLTLFLIKNYSCNIL